ncbi:hypothetical protein ACE41H_15505 [Paenibacillus enshidis]|uniref:Uncharacterized protein n=1 Tax=Paenibacillus enshidis TaxID=1458439 RepID=A0ABV5AVD7_9BACL
MHCAWRDLHVMEARVLLASTKLCPVPPIAETLRCCDADHIGGRQTQPPQLWIRLDGRRSDHPGPVVALSTYRPPVEAAQTRDTPIFPQSITALFV